MIILFGMAGSGKGTQGQALAEHLGWRWISNGEVIRDSHQYDDIIRRGELIPDHAVNDMMGQEIAKAKASSTDVILDGYPRDLSQARYVAEHYEDQIHAAIVIDVPKSELYRRLAARGRADDQNRASIDKRFSVFEQNICSILSLFESKNIPVRHVDGTGTPAEVTHRIRAVLQELEIAHD